MNEDEHEFGADDEAELNEFIRHGSPVPLDPLVAEAAQRYGYPARDYATYLRSEHWHGLKTRRSPAKCDACQRTVGVELHHLTYQTLYRERDEDLLWLCEEHHKRVHVEFRRLSGSIRNENQEPTLRTVTLNLVRRIRGPALDLEPYRAASVGTLPILVGSRVRVTGLDAQWYVIGRTAEVPTGTAVLDPDSKLAKALLYKRSGESGRYRGAGRDIPFRIVEVQPPKNSGR